MNYEMNTKSDRLKVWKRIINSNGSFTLIKKGFRFGLLALQGKNDKGIVKYCLACKQRFTDNDDALTHPCKYEEEFREVTNRPLPAAYDDKYATTGITRQEEIPEPQQQIVINPEEWVLWNYKLSVELATAKEELQTAQERIKELAILNERLTLQIDGFRESANRSKTVALSEEQAKAYEDQRR